MPQLICDSLLEDLEICIEGSFGMDCTDLGISMTNSSSTAAPPALNDNSNNEGKLTTV